MTAFTSNLSSSLGCNNIIQNGGFENAPSFTAATNTNQRWIDGTAAGSSFATSPYLWAVTTKNGTVAAQFDSANPHNGANSLKVSLLAVASFIECHQVRVDSAAGRTGLATPVSPSTTYICTFWMKTNYVSGDSNDGAYVAMANYDSSYNAVGASSGTITSTKVKTTTGWTQYSFTFTTSASCAYVVAECRIYGHTGTATLIMDAWFDDIILQQVPTVTLAKQSNRQISGSLGSAGAFVRATIHAFAASIGFAGLVARAVAYLFTATISFTGQAGRSFRRSLPTASVSPAGNAAKTPQILLNGSFAGNNIVPNGNFEVAPSTNVPTTSSSQVYINGTATGGSTIGRSFGWIKGANAGTSSAVFDSTNPHSGGYAMKLSTLATGSYVELFAPVIGGGTSGYNGKIIPVQPSTDYTFTFWMKTNYVSGDSNDGAAIALIESKSDGSSAGQTTSSTYTKTTTSWTQYILQFTTTSLTTYIQINPRVYGHTGTATLIMDAWFDELTLVPTYGVFVRQPNKTLTATLTSVGSYIWQLPRLLTASLSHAGSIVATRIRYVVVSGILSYTGLIQRRSIKSLSAAFSITNYIFGSGTFGDSGTFGFSPTDALVKRTNKLHTAVVTTSGVFNRTLQHLLSSAVSFSGAVRRVVTYPLVAVISFAGNTNRNIRHLLNAASVSSSGSLTPSRIFFRPLTGTLSFAGSIGRIFLKSLRSTLGLVGNLRKFIIYGPTKNPTQWTDASHKHPAVWVEKDKDATPWRPFGR